MVAHLPFSQFADKEGHVVINIYRSVLQPQSGTGTLLWSALYYWETELKTFASNWLVPYASFDAQRDSSFPQGSNKIIFFCLIVYWQPENCSFFGYSTSLPKAVEIGRWIKTSSQEDRRQAGTEHHYNRNLISGRKQKRSFTPEIWHQ